MTSEDYVKSNSGLIYRDFEIGKGDCPKDGQQVFLLFMYLLILSLKAMIFLPEPSMDVNV